jgi:hypothetical protein
MIALLARVRALFEAELADVAIKSIPLFERV